MPTSELKHD